MKLDTRINNAYRQWCKQTFPDYKVQDFPLKGRMYEVWRAAWFASMDYMDNRRMANDDQMGKV